MTAVADQWPSAYVSISCLQFLIYGAAIFFGGYITVQLCHRFPRNPGE